MFLRVSRQYLDSLDRITAAQLLPIAATIVASAVGAEIANILDDPQNALGTIIACYVLWGIGVPLALTILVIYYQRLAVHKLPPREVIVSSFLPLGPLGFGGFAYEHILHNSFVTAC
jgi:tellurite resistance protein TehA-like permease